MIVYSDTIFIKRHRSSSADLNKFCFMKINFNFVTMVGLATMNVVRFTVCVWRNTGVPKE